MSRATLATGERPLHWIRSSLKDFECFPEEVQDHIGFALSVAQFGGKSPDAKPWKGGLGVFEVVEDFRGDTFRAVYTVRFAEAVYVLHAFQKKSTKGIATSNADRDLIAKRLKNAVDDHRSRYGKERD